MRRTSATGFATLLRSAPRGGAIVEFALVAPFLVLLAIGLFDLGLGLWQKLQVQAAAEAGAQYAAQHPDPWDAAKIAAIAAAVTSATGASGSALCPPPSGKISACPAPSQVCGCTNNNTFTPVGSPTGGSCGSITCTPSGTAGLYASVSAQMPYSALLPWPWVNPPPAALTAQAYRRLK
ncbi:MAG: TadE family protein [Stellaceae bacterium]